MPNYEYCCDACGHRFEVLQNLNDEPKQKCPECKKPKLRRLMGVPALIFKGTGFYVTDYKNKEGTKE